MKIPFVLIILVPLIAGDGCKNDKQEAKPPATKKVEVTTAAGGSKTALANGQALSAKFFNPRSTK